MSDTKKIYVLDTNVLIHDPDSIFSFEEHDVLVPMIVLEELDKLKSGLTPVAADARQAVRTIDRVIFDSDPGEMTKGVLLNNGTDAYESGRLYIQMSGHEFARIGVTSSQANDNQIIHDVIALQKEKEGQLVTLITKDINMRLKAKGGGIAADDYQNDQLITDIERLSTGYHHVSGSFWELLDDIKPHKITGESLQLVELDALSTLLNTPFYVNQFILDEKEFVGRIKDVDDRYASIELLNTGMMMRQKVWGLAPRDIYQAIAMYLIMDPDIDLVSLNGPAGSGKTIMALACALEQTMEENTFNRIIATRSTRGLDEDIGFLPGTETEKMTPWLGAFTDNLEALHSEDLDPTGSSDYVGSNVPILFKSMNFVRGRSFQHSFLIVDEAQNLTPHQVKTIITRAGEGTKVVCLGNLAQIDTPYLRATSSGLTYMSERFKGFKHGGSIALKGVARSRLAEYAEQHL